MLASLRCQHVDEDLQEEGSEHADSYREPGRGSQKQDPKAGTCLGQAFTSFLAYKLLLHTHMQNPGRVQPQFLCPVEHCLQPQAWQTLESVFFPCNKKCKTHSLSTCSTRYKLRMNSQSQEKQLSLMNAHFLSLSAK